MRRRRPTRQYVVLVELYDVEFLKNMVSRDQVALFRSFTVEGDVDIHPSSNVVEIVFRTKEASDECVGKLKSAKNGGYKRPATRHLLTFLMRLKSITQIER